MNDREKTNLLTKVGFLHLRNQGCFEIATEVKMPHWGLRDFQNEADRHYLIDLVGVRWKYLPHTKQYTKKTKIGETEYEHTVIKEPVTRGIEIKVSKSDLKNGFIHSGCHSNFLMAPKGLVSKKNIHKDVGIIEVDLEQLSIRKYRKPFYGYALEGVSYLRSSKSKYLTDEQLSRIRGQIAYKLTLQTSLWLRDELLQSPLLNAETEK